MTKVDVLLIGSGISSLTSALLLAKRGKKVLVLEQYSKPGGYLHCFSRFGQRYDTGAHYVGAMAPGHALHTLLKYLEVLDEDDYVPLDPTGFDEFHFPEFRFDMPKGYPELESSLGNLFPAERAGIARYFALVRKAVTYFPTYHFDDGYNEVPAADIFEKSLAKVVNELIQDPRLKAVMYAYCTLHGVEPEDVAFGFHAIVTDSLIQSPYGLRNGGDSLAEKFVRRLRELGGEVLLKQKVTSIEVRDRYARTVTTESGETYSAEWVISSAHPKLTFDLCDDTTVFPSVFRSRLENLRESCSLLGVSAMTENAGLNPRRNYYYFDSSDPKRMFAADDPTARPSVVFLSPAERDAEGATLPINLHAAAPLSWFEDWKGTNFGRRPDAYKRTKTDLAERALGLVEAFRPGFRSHVTKFAVSTPLTNLHFNGSPEGSAYGLYHSIQNTGPRAIGPRTKVLNLLLTGQSTLFPGILAGAVAGLRTTGHVVGIKPFLRELKEMGANP